MGIFSKLFKKKEIKYELDVKNRDNLVVMLMPKHKIRLSSKIVVPDSFCAVFLSREKLLDEVPCGEFEISGLNFPKVCKINKLDKPTKKGYKTEFNADIYYVNLSETIIKDGVFIERLKKEIEYCFKVKIFNPKKFLEFLFLEQIVFENDYAFKELTFYTSQLIYYFVLDNKNNYKAKIENYVVTKLKQIGVEIIEFELKDDGKDIKNLETKDEKDNSDNYDLDYGYKFGEENSFNGKDEKIRENQNFDNINDDYNEKNNNIEDSFQNINEKTLSLNEVGIENSIKQNENKGGKNENSGEGFKKKSIYNLDDIKTENVAYFVCDNCGAKLPSSSTRCFVCGKSFIEKEVCENCGCEVRKTDFVCPNCKSVIIH